MTKRRSPNCFSHGDVLDIGGYHATVTRLTATRVWTDGTTPWTYDQLARLVLKAKARA